MGVIMKFLFSLSPGLSILSWPLALCVSDLSGDGVLCPGSQDARAPVKFPSRPSALSRSVIHAQLPVSIPALGALRMIAQLISI